MIKKTLTILVLSILIGCSDNDNLKKNFINNGDYWAVYYQKSEGFYGHYFKFKSNGKSDQYCTDYNSISLCDGSDLVTNDISWEVTSDSILKWGIHKYYIVNCTADIIVLYTGAKENGHLFLVKEYPEKLRKDKVYYENLDKKSMNEIH